MTVRLYSFSGLLAALLWGCLASWPVFAQLGPVDGQDLSATARDRVQVGQPAPDFRLVSGDGSTVRLSRYRDQNEVVLIFYRGHW